jgi:pyruvate,water dikinase
VANASVYKCPDGSDFPVEWPDPQDAEFSWKWDAMHSPIPLTRLCWDLREEMGEGFKRAFDVSGAPGYGVSFVCNGFMYSRPALFDDDPQVRAAVAKRDSAQRMDCILELWNQSYRPEVEALTRATKSWVDDSFTLKQQVERFDQVRAARRRLGEIHMLTMGPANGAANRFIDFCQAEFGADGEQVASQLTQGFPNKALETGINLWQLSSEALERPAVAAALRDGETGLDRLRVVDGGPGFVAILERFLQEYGHRSESFLDLSYPQWTEDARFPLFMVRRYLDTPEDQSPTALHSEAVRHRDKKYQEVEKSLAGDPEKLERFRAWLRSAQQRTVLLEDHNFYIDQQGWTSARFPCLALGRKLAEQGSIAGADDVFHLRVDEIYEAAARPTVNYSSVVQQRRADRAHWMRNVPPSLIGAGQHVENPYADRFFGPANEAPSTDGVVKGIAASQGIVRGTARVILSLDEVDRLADGEILVTMATAPPWTPLFAVAGGLVTEAGGTLSHAAVVAREYKIPAVVGAKGAITRIPDGALITLDGAAGTVRIESEA